MLKSHEPSYGVTRLDGVMRLLGWDAKWPKSYDFSYERSDVAEVVRLCRRRHSITTPGVRL